MNWFTFSIALGFIYGLYYLAIMFRDMTSGADKKSSNVHSNELTFSEDHQPEKIVVDTPVVTTTSAISALGGLSLKNLFQVALSETVEYTRGISF